MGVPTAARGCVLVAHDELLRGALLARACHEVGLTPVIAFTADGVLETLDRLAVEAVVASAALPVRHPIDLVTSVRRRTGAPLVLLCGEGQSHHEADLHVDADEPTETVAGRVRGLVSAPPPVRRLQVWGPLHLEAATRQAWWQRVPLSLTVQQFALLRRLVRAQGGVVTTAELSDAVYGQEAWHDAERIRAHVRRIRRRIAAVDPRGATAVATVRGVGFRLRE